MIFLCCAHAWSMNRYNVPKRISLLQFSCVMPSVVSTWRDERIAHHYQYASRYIGPFIRTPISWKRKILQEFSSIFFPFIGATPFPSDGAICMRRKWIPVDFFWIQRDHERVCKKSSKVKKFMWNVSECSKISKTAETATTTTTMTTTTMTTNTLTIVLHQTRLMSKNKPLWKDIYTKQFFRSIFEVGWKKGWGVARRAVMEIKMHQLCDVPPENLFLLPACDF